MMTFRKVQDDSPINEQGHDVTDGEIWTTGGKQSVKRDTTRRGTKTDQWMSELFKNVERDNQST